MRQQAKHINFKKMTTIFQIIARLIETFKVSHLYILCGNFAVANEVQNIYIKRKAMQLLYGIAILCAKNDIKMQAY